MSQETLTLSRRGDAIRRYKARANEEGAAAWADVPCAPDIRMHVPSYGIEAVGPEEINQKIFADGAASGRTQELIELHEHGCSVTCFLRVTTGDVSVDAVEVFLFDDQDRVAEIWALVAG